jgi:dTDP-4-dehydrorhamnose 3,5-epimerase
MGQQIVFEPTSLDGVILVKPAVFGDERGFFLETYHQEKYQAHGIVQPFVQDNHSYSRRGTLRGLHAQLRYPQGKLVRAIVGTIFDVAVDARPDSPAFGKWVSAVLSSDNHHQLYVPPGYVHGFVVTSETAHVQYKCTDFYHPEDEISVLWNDPGIGIEWPPMEVGEPILKDKDRTAPRLADIVDTLRAAGY